MRTDVLVAQVRAAFERVHRAVFLGDPVANARLSVDVVDVDVVHDAPTLVLVLVTPWTVNGLIFTPDDAFPEALEIAGRRRPVFRVELTGLATFRSVNLPVDTAALRSMAQARTLARSWVPPLHQAIRTALAAPALGGRSGPPSPAGTPDEGPARC
ncbi:[NiFe]-hydrogenase assembly chaperone HybE [Actinoplanes sp. NPDC049599]|uniref:[NiFe]-hydrogenase assembly chaperone HybE n=1 Tax=Actinoplanes sp. NPDC049599 TaxID=3363903 RepID=UPI0037A5018B